MLTLEGGETARRRVPDSELIYPTQEESDRIKAVVDRLVNARLMVKGQLETGDWRTIHRTCPRLPDMGLGNVTELD